MTRRLFFTPIGPKCPYFIADALCQPNDPVVCKLVSLVVDSAVWEHWVLQPLRAVDEVEQAGAFRAQRAAADRVIRFEAAVAGGIPVIKALTEGLAGNQMRRVMGVMNGSCNYILTRMQSENLPYETVFEEARQLGYLEADPNLDVGGIDAGHKLSLLAAIAFGTSVSFDAVELEGVNYHTWRVTRNGTVERIKVEVLGSLDAYYIVQSDIQPGDQLVVRGQQGLSVGQLVELISRDAPP